PQGGDRVPERQRARRVRRDVLDVEVARQQQVEQRGDGDPGQRGERVGGVLAARDQALVTAQRPGDARDDAPERDQEAEDDREPADLAHRTVDGRSSAARWSPGTASAAASVSYWSDSYFDG